MTATTALGADLDTTWNALLRGESGIGALDGGFVGEFDLPVRIGGTLRESPEAELSRTEQRRLSFGERLALVLARRVWSQAGPPQVEPERLAVAVGTGLGGGDALVTAVDALRTRGHRAVSPLAVPMIMPNGPAATIGLEIGARAGVFTPVSACASGAEAVALGWRLIRDGAADVVVAGGVEGHIDAVPIASFAMMRAMSTRNDEPTRASRPFDRGRDGFVLGEGAALLVLESERHARARGATVHARLLGTGITSDAYHIVASDPSGAGAARAIRAALRSGGLEAGDIGYVNAHATSTPIGDASEASALTAVTPHAAVYAPKSALGHSIGAAGALEAALTVRALCDQASPPTLNVDDPEFDLDIITGAARPLRARYAISNSFGFGGHNVALAFGHR